MVIPTSFDIPKGFERHFVISCCEEPHHRQDIIVDGSRMTRAIFLRFEVSDDRMSLTPHEHSSMLDWIEDSLMSVRKELGVL